jgi:carbon dioxide concentrating mechanism protein CcmM
MEYADERRFRTSSWYSCAVPASTRAPEVMSALETCIAEHSGEYVRLIGIDPKDRRRVLEVIVQRPGGPATLPSAMVTSGSTTFAPSPSAKTTLSPELVAQVRGLLSQGYKIGTEHADKRRFSINAWNSCAPITAQHEAGVFTALEACLAEHQGDYVRLIGIDPKDKRRVAENTIQRP